MSDNVDNFITDARASMATTTASLKNIAADEDLLVKKYDGLLKQYEEVLANGVPMSNADLEKLTVFGNDLRAVAAASKAIADALPEPVPA